MPNLPISQLPELTAVTSNAEFAVAQGGTTYKVKQSTLNPFSQVYGLFSQTGSTIPITGTTEQSMINGGIGTLTVGANQFQVGDSFEAVFGGRITNTNNHTIQIRVKTDSTILADSGAISIAANSSAVFYLTLNFTIRSVGGPGVASIITLATFQTSKTANASLEGFGFDDINNTTFDTTISNVLDVTLQFGTTGDNLEVEIFRLNKVY